MPRNTDRPTDWSLETNLVRGGFERTAYRETAEPIFMTSGYVYDSADEAAAAFEDETRRFVYSRYGNPTVTTFERRLALLEGAEACKAAASGMAAVHAALLCQVRAGDRVVSSRALFGSCNWIVSELLPRYGVETELVDGTDLAQWRAALRKPTKAVFLESPSNPGLEIVNLPAVADLAHRVGARVIVDNVFATPILQRPLELGADIVVYSATKHIDGQGRCLGGAILGSAQFIKDEVQPFAKHTGPALSPFNAWILLKGLETMALRVRHQCASALAVAEALSRLPGIAEVRYPTLPSHPQHDLARRQMKAGGTVVAFTVEGGREGAFACLNRLRLVDISNNLGDSKSLATHPATTTHKRLTPEERTRQGIPDGLIRLSIGLEAVEDIVADLTQALTPAYAAA